MSDFIWFIIIGILFLLISVSFIILGFMIWIKQKMNLIISHHCDKVSERNKKAYCTMFGIGMIIMGAGFGLTGILTFFIHSLLIFVPMTLGLIIGIALIIISGAKYNHSQDDLYNLEDI